MVTEDIRQVNVFNNANREVTKYLDKYLFDYDTGVPNTKGLRSELAQAETLEERENVATRIVGSRGYTYNSKGEMALTHEGLRRLGLPVKYIKQPDGSRQPINTIIDSRNFEGAADLADFAGISGPIIGSLIAMAPPFKAFGAAKKLTRMFGDRGSTRAANVLTAAAGSAAGKGVEEAVDYLQGYQKQSLGEIGGELSSEALLGGIGQGIGEGIGILFANTLGKNALKSTNRLQREAAAGRDLQDLQKLDKQLGKEATRKQIEAAVKKYDYEKGGYQPGAIRMNPVAYVVSQAGLGRSLPGRFQQIMESILGNTRTRGNIENINMQVSRLVGDLNKQKNVASDYYKDALQGGIRGETKIGIDRSIANKKAELDKLVLNNNVKLEQAIKDMTEDLTGVGIYNSSIGQREFGQLLIENMDRARRAIDNTFGQQYRALDDAFREAVAVTPVKGQASVVQRKIATILSTRVKNIKKELDGYEEKIVKGIDQPGDLPASALQPFKDAVEELEGMVKNPETLNMPRIIDAVKDLRKYKYTTLNRGQMNKMYEKMANELGFDQTIYKDGRLIPLRDDPVFGMSRNGGFMDDLTDVNKYGITYDANGKKIPALGITTRDNLAKFAEEFKDINNRYATANASFDNFNLKRISEQAKVGSNDADEIYANAFIKGDYADLRDIFKNLRQYDEYTAGIGQASNVEQDVRTIMQQQFFREALDEALDTTTGNVNFVQFGKFMKDFQRKDARKLEELFGADVARQVQSLSDDLIKLKPNIKSDEVLDLLGNISVNRQGYAAVGRASVDFMEALKGKASAQLDKELFEANKFISERLPDATAEEVVSKIFTPRGADNIAKVRDVIGDEAFLEIQNASMDKLLRTAIRPGTKGEVTDIFKPAQLASALDSYGDETLEAMFGKETKDGLRYLANSLDVLTKGEAGRGAAAGGLIAASLAVGFLNVAAIPLAAGIIIMRGALSNPRLVRMMASTDKNSVQTVFDYFDRAIKQYLTREVAGGLEAVNETVRGEVANLASRPEAEQFRDMTTRAVQSVDMPVPDLSSYGITQPDSASVLEREERLGFDPILGP
jgi:hypothetical protein